MVYLRKGNAGVTIIAQHIDTVVKDSPPVAVLAMSLFGIELSSWVLILTAVYTIIRIVIELHTWYVRNRKKKEQDYYD